eukprot:592482-Alexandrium_andersonii.AAC.1
MSRLGPTQPRVAPYSWTTGFSSLARRGTERPVFVEEFGQPQRMLPGHTLRRRNRRSVIHRNP